MTKTVTLSLAEYEELNRKQPNIPYVNLYSPNRLLTSSYITHYTDNLTKEVEEQVNTILENANQTIATNNALENTVFFKNIEIKRLKEELGNIPNWIVRLFN